MKNKILLLNTFLCCFIHINLRCQSNDRVSVGDPCPTFTLISSGTQKNVSSQSLKGSVTLINFFATWCGPCLRELPELEKKIWEEFRGNATFNLMVIGRGHGEKEIEIFKNKHCYDFPMYADSTKSVYNAFADKYIPRNYIVDREGKIAYSSVNYTPLEFEKILQKLREALK